jgi:hypothetical protein
MPPEPQCAETSLEGSEMMKLYRQGDVVLREIPRLPDRARPTDERVLAYGEKTGHTHRLEGHGQVWRQDTRLYLALEQPSQVVHEDHRPVTVAPGLYEVIGQREYVSPEEDRRAFD